MKTFILNVHGLLELIYLKIHLYLLAPYHSWNNTLEKNWKNTFKFSPEYIQLLITKITGIHFTQLANCMEIYGKIVKIVIFYHIGQ